MGEIKLNSAQASAVDHDQGPLLVVAGAGTGKTSVITERIVRLINSGVPRESILALTFTEKAASEMLDRVSSKLEASYGLDLRIHTFNAFGSELLREFAAEIGFSSNPRLLGEQGKLIVLREHLDDLNLDYFSPVSSPISQLSAIADYFSLLKQQLVTPQSYKTYASSLPTSDDAERLERLKHQELAGAFETYISLCQSNGFIDYDDQIYLSVQLLEKRPNILAKLTSRFTYILVDEFQDTNPMQSRLIDLLAGDSKSLMVVGDDDQSIYGWRGATLSNILSFTERYKAAKIITLTENYRSTQHILDDAYRLIQHNNPYRLEHINAIDKQLVAARGKGAAPEQHCFATLDLELDWVAKDIQRKILSGIDPGQIAVLARRSDGVRRLHEALELRDIDHTTVGVTSNIYDQPIVQTMVQALRAVTDPQDQLALYHTLTGDLFKLPPSTMAHLSSAARRSNALIQDVASESEHAEVVAALHTIEAWRTQSPTLSVGRLAYLILDESGLKDTLLKAVGESSEGEFAAQSMFKWFKTLQEFQRSSSVATTVSYLSVYDTLRADGELIEETTDHQDQSKPVIMTIHKSKGLEWKHVYIIDCTEGSLPLTQRSSSLTVPDELSLVSAADSHYHEERRLMYVAMTRARSNLTLTYAQSHNGVTQRKPSRFIREIFGEPISLQATQASAQVELNLFSTPPTHSIELPTKFRSGDNLVLSATQVNDYLRCPLDFYYRHILGTPAEPSPAAAVGSLVHAIVQNIFTARQNGLAVPDLETVLHELEANWPINDYASAKQRYRALQNGLKGMAACYDTLANGPMPIEVEMPFRVHIPNSKLILKGQIDAIFGTDKGVEIRDYKTGSALTNEKAKTKTGSSKQLEMYALAYRIKTGEMPVAVTLDYLLSGTSGSVKKQAKTLDNLEKKLADIADAILTGHFEPGTDHEYCRHP